MLKITTLFNYLPVIPGQVNYLGDKHVVFVLVEEDEFCMGYKSKQHTM